MFQTIRRMLANTLTCRAPATHPEGYNHWYCMKPRWHGKQTPARGLVDSSRVHRFNNYIWRDGEEPLYEPIPFDVSTSLRQGLSPRWSVDRNSKPGAHRDGLA